MIVVSRSIHIGAPVERVFALITDPLARAQLHPESRPIRVEIEGGGPLRLGSVCHFRLQLADRIVDYRTEVQQFEANRRIVSVSDSAVAFELTLTTVPENGGTRLTQTERFEPSAAMLEKADEREGRFLRWLEPILMLLDADHAQRIHARREELLTRRLELKLERWLEAIRAQLEKTDSQD